MKKLGKKTSYIGNAIEAYACSCFVCYCGCNPQITDDDIKDARDDRNWEVAHPQYAK